MRLIKEITDMDILGRDGRSSKLPRLTARAFLFNKEGLLAVMYSNKYGLYTIPGGGLEEGEDQITAVKRELREETGCDCEIKGELGYVQENRAHCNYTSLSYYYVAEVTYDYGKTQLSESEINNGTSVGWYPLEEAIRLIGTPTHEVVQRRFLQSRDMAAFEALNEFLLSANTKGLVLIKSNV